LIGEGGVREEKKKRRRKKEEGVGDIFLGARCADPYSTVLVQM